ncbi:MAG: carbonate dehydratase [Planctomycetota bacterium]|nr:carbonate dehydratase [Planctomycetota bacterium]
MRVLGHLIENNRRWAERLSAQQPGFFRELAALQRPEYLWIGCSDSRVPANQIVDLRPGELFVQRNIANQFSHTDLNGLSVLQFAVDVLSVKHVIVCGHYGCGGVQAALQNVQLGIVDNWIRGIKDLAERNRAELDALTVQGERVDRLCELNVAQQVANVCHSTVVQGAWKHGKELSVHGWIYHLEDGLLHDLGLCFSSPEQVPPIYHPPSPLG